MLGCTECFLYIVTWPFFLCNFEILDVVIVPLAINFLKFSISSVPSEFLILLIIISCSSQLENNLRLYL